MQIVENTDQTLVVEERPRLIRAILWLVAGAQLYALLTVEEEAWRVAIVVFVLIGTAAAAVLGFPTMRYEFDRETGQLFRTRWYLGMRRRDEMALTKIREVRQEARWTGASRSRRLVIETTDGPSAMTPSHGSRDLAPVAEAINEWLSRPVGGHSG